MHVKFEKRMQCRMQIDEDKNMSSDVENRQNLWPLGVKIQLFGKPKTEGVVESRPGITTLVGPNGSGKTRALRAIKSALEGIGSVAIHNRKIHFLAAGRSSPLEPYRARVNEPFETGRGDAAVGQAGYRDQWWNFESIIGSLLALDSRADLRLKVEARLQQLFDRSVRLSWSQQGLCLQIQSMSGGTSYAANHEASGILQLVALLAAIHNNEIGALLIDEPEISLHPQHQAFLLEEMEAVAGEPSDPERKLIVIATHSASLLPLRKIGELPAIAFFSSARKPPAQVSTDDGILQRAKLAGMVARLSATHRMAMFAERVLLVEGPSDEIIATQLARRLDLRLLARNAQILPIGGKGEFAEATKLFRLMNKQIGVLADLDALADSNSLVCQFSELPEAAAIAAEVGRTSLADLDKDLRDALGTFMAKHKATVDAKAEAYPDWSSKDSSELSPRRVTLARVLSDPESFEGAVAGDADILRTRYNVLLDALAKLGCFFLRQGAIENYYRVTGIDRSKPDLAAEEAIDFDASIVSDLNRDYADVVAALLYIAPNQRIDEDKLLKLKLAAVLSPVLLSMDHKTSDSELNATAKATIGVDAEIFKLSNRSKDGLPRIEVGIASPLFQRDTFPFEVGRDDNPNVVVPTKLPGVGQK